MRGKKLAWATILAIAIMGATMIGTVGATVTKVSVVPGNVGMMYPGTTFDVSVVVADVVGLSAYDFKLKWDPFVIRPLEVTQGPFLSQDGVLDTFFKYKIEMTWDRMLVGEMIMGPQTTSGSGTLATITFIAVGAGSTSIDLYESKMLDIDVATMPCSEFDGKASVHMVAELKSVWPEASIVPVGDESVCLSAEIEHLGVGFGAVNATVKFIGFDMGGNMIILQAGPVELAEGESAIVENCEFNATAYGEATYRFYASCRYWKGATPETPMHEFYSTKEKSLKFQVR